MKILLPTCLLFMLLLPISLKGQEEDIVIHGDYQDVPFEEFVRDVEQQTGLYFYYLEDWVRGSGSPLPVMIFP